MSTRLLVSVSLQEASLFENEKLIRIYRISTSAYGLGSEPGSLKTPLGLHRIAEKIGAGCAPGTIFKSRVPTGEIWSPAASAAVCAPSDDLVLSRILWLEGCEEKNRGTRERFIYLHGTNQIERLGERASHGCIRLSNSDIIDLFERITEGTLIEIIS